jgi:hypothetical protein
MEPTPDVVLSCNYCRRVGVCEEVRIYSKFPLLTKTHERCPNDPYYCN